MITHHFIATDRSPVPEKRTGPEDYVALEKTAYFKNVDFDDSVLYVLKFNEGNETLSYKKIWIRL